VGNRPYAISTVIDLQPPSSRSGDPQVHQSSVTSLPVSLRWLDSYLCFSTILTIWSNFSSMSLTILNWVRHLSRLWFSLCILK